jgi:hypothetical protein
VPLGDRPFNSTDEDTINEQPGEAAIAPEEKSRSNSSGHLSHGQSEPSGFCWPHFQANPAPIAVSDGNRVASTVIFPDFVRDYDKYVFTVLRQGLCEEMESMLVSWAAIAAGLGEHRSAGDGSRPLIRPSLSACFVLICRFSALLRRPRRR